MDERPTHTHLRLTTASDCLVLMEGVRRGLFRLVTRRLTDAERSLYIKPGSVFVWQEGDNCSRWTDGLAWGPSRMREPFLFYDEKPASSSTAGTDTLDPANRSGSSARGRAAPYDRGPKPSTKNTYGGLVKQTFSTLVRLNDDSSVKWHVVAYFTTDSHSNIPGVKDDSTLKDIEVPVGIYESARQRKPGTATSRDRSAYGKERTGVKSKPSEGLPSPLPSPVPIPRRYSTQATVPGLASPTSSFGYGLPSPASVPDLTRMYQKRPTSDTHSPPPQFNPPMSWPKYPEDMAPPFAFSPPLMPQMQFRSDNDFGPIAETPLHIASRSVVDFSAGAAPPFNDSEPPRTLEAFRFFEQRLAGARHFALLRPLAVDDHLVFYGPSLFPTIEMSSLYEAYSTNRRPPNTEFLATYFRPSIGYEGQFDRPFTINLLEPIRQGQNRWAQVWRANLRCSTGGGVWTQGSSVVVKLFQESLFPPPTSEDLLGDKSECAWYSMKEQAEAEAWAYDMLKAHQGQLCPYSYGMYEFSLPCGEQRVIGHVMEDVNSFTLDEYFHVIGGEMNIEKTWEIATAAVQGLQTIHASGVAHRDLKPRHVLVPKDQLGNVVFVDFTYSANDGPADSQPLYDTLRESGFVNGIDKWVTATGGHTLLANPPTALQGTTPTPDAPQF
ncbi:cAMP-independent regulatory protein pac2 [Ceratobasidium sp. AG-Ba]|nr:cAMP-independent regulatory protein pac2 [Ceratobasidium sp. AG-Ba]